MPSWQFRLMRIFFQLRRRFQRISPQVDVSKERSELEALTRFFNTRVQVQWVPEDIEGIPSEWVIPTTESNKGVILYLHGGSYIAGSINTHRTLVAEIAAAADARVLIIDYRLAPEHPFPAAVEDANRAYQWLLKAGNPAEGIAIVGDSAGGGLVLAALLMLQEEGIPLPACAVCICPWIDLTCSGESWRKNAKADLLVEGTNLCGCAELYLHGSDPRTPLASPIFADLHGLPPVYIQVGSDEVLLSDATQFSELAEAAGVEMRLEVWQDMQHLWQLATQYIPESRQAVKKIGDYLREKMLINFSS
jgi:monoterpene epsilon-lactone hydrolase